MADTVVHNDDFPNSSLDSEEAPFVMKKVAPDGDEGRRGRVFDSLLDKTGYGWFHLIIILGEFHL